MKKITLLILSLGLCLAGWSQTLNQNASWPNTNWSVTGTFNTNPLAFESDPTSTANFAFDDDDAGGGNDDQIAAESPIIDLTAAFTAGETWVTISGNFVYNYNNSDILQFEYWDADASTWNIIGTPINADTAGAPLNNFCAGTTEAYTTDVLDIVGFTPTQLSGFRYRIYWDDSTSGAAWQWGFCFDAPTITSATPPSCINVSSVTIDSVTSDAITVSWSENNTPAGTAWEVVAVPGGDPAPVAGTSNATTNPYTITSLTSNTSYDVYVRADCSTTFVAPINIMTSAACGDTVYDTGGAASNYSDNESYTITYLPDTAANVVTLDFILVDLENCCDTLTIYDGSDTSAPVLAADLQGPAVFSALNPAGAITVEFNSDSSVNRAGWEANYTCTPRPSCIDVSSVTIDSVTSDATTVSWSENNIPAGTAWEVVAVPGGDPVPVAGTSNATTNPYTITSLTANTSYDVYVRADCSTTFVGPTSLTTLCSPVVAPYTENFDNAGAIPACWNQGIQNSENWLFADGTASEPAHGGNNGAIVDHTSGTGFFAWVNDSSPHSTGTSLESVLVDVSGLTSPALSFWINSDREDSTNVQFSVDFWDGAAWNIGVYTSNSNTNGWAQGLVDLSVYTITGPVQARFVVDENNGTDFDDDFAIDDVSFDEAPSCFAPTNAVVTAISTDGATIDYTNSNTSTNTNIEYGALGFVQGTGTSLSYTTIPFSLTGLMSGTTYDYYLQSDCGMGDLTSWVGPFSFTTDCSAVADFNENFDTVATPGLPNCWSSIVIENATGTDPSVTTSTSADNTAPNGARLYNGSGDLSTPNDVLLISPELTTLSSGTHRLRFFGDGSPAGDVEVGTITDPTNPLTFTLLETVAITTTHTQYTVDFSTYTGADQYIAFRHPNTTTFDNIYLDDIIFEAIPSCLAPSDIILTASTTTTAVLGWTNNASATVSSVIYGAPGFDPLSAGTTVVGAGDNATITGLNANTTYEAYVIAVCGGGDTSSLVGPFSFTTDCSAVADFNENFDTVATPGLPNCWSSIVIENATGTDPSVTTSTSADNTAPNGARLYNGSGDLSTPNDVLLISPELTTLSSGTHRLRFFGDGSPAGDVEVGTITDPTNPLTFTLLETVAITTTHTQYTVDFSTYTGADQYIAFRHPNTTTFDSIYLDDIIFEAIPSCLAPSDIVLIASTDTDVTIGWTNNSTALVSSVTYGAAGFDPLVTGTTVAGTGNMAMISGLTAETSYDFYVTQDCSATGDGLSSQSGPLSITTPCAAISAPYFVDFENFTAATSGFVSDQCWNEVSPTAYDWAIDNSGGTGSSGTGPSGAFSGTTFMFVEASNGASGDVATVLSPAVDLSALTVPSFSFYYHMYGSQITSLQVGVSIDNGATFTNELTITGQQQLDSTDPWVQSFVDLSAYANQTVIVSFSTTKGTGSSDYEGDVSIDDVAFGELPTCINVSSVTIDSVTSDAITVSWTENNTPAGTAWEVVVVPAGDPAPIAGTSNATTNPYIITSLTANTSYDVYVRTDCSVNFTGPVLVTTDCEIISVYPYVTDFTNNVPNTCWNEAGSGEIVNGPMNVGSSDWKAGRSYENFAGTATPSNLINLYSNNDREWLISESYDMSGTSNDVLSIEVAVTDYQFSGASDATDTDTMGSDDQVDLLITTDAGMTWTSLMTWTAANQPSVTGTREFIDLSSYTGTVQFAFFASDGTVNDTEDYDFHVGMFIIDGTAGNEDVFASTLSLYPNPVNGDVVTISMGHTSASSIEVAVFNTLGQQVMTRSFDQVNHTINIDNISSLSNGMYFVKVTSSTQQATLKFIKE